jgi:hypothetical protein
MGGVRRLSFLAAGYVALLIGVAVLFRASIDIPLPRFCAQALSVLSVIQALVVVIGGLRAVYRAVRRDAMNRMLEVYRGSPMSNLSAVLGYVFGSTLSVVLMFLIGLGYGLGLAILSGDSVVTWLQGNLALLVAAMCLWPAAVFFAMSPARRSVVPGFFVIGMLTAPAWAQLLPGVAALSGVAAVLWSSNRMMMSTRFAGMGLSLVVLVGMALFWIRAANRRFRRPDFSPLSNAMALTFVIIWAAAATAGQVVLEGLPRGGGAPLEFRIIAFWITMLLIAVLPFAMALQPKRRAIENNPKLPWRARLAPYWWGAAGAVVVLAVAPVWRLSAASNPTQFDMGAWTTTITALLLALVFASAVLQCSYYATRSFIAGGVILVAAWIVPPLADFIRREFALETHGVAEYTSLFGASPMGTVIGLWLDIGAPLRLGLLMQGAVTGVAVVMAARVQHQFVIRRRALHTPRSPR